MLLDGSRNRADAAQTKTEYPGIRFPRSKSSHWLRDPASGRYERENMLQNSIQSKSAKSLLQRLIGIRLTRLPTLAAVAWGMAASLSPATVHAQEYPWCLSRESYLYCFYKTQEQCQWTASGIGGCALNPRLLFRNKPRDSDQNLLSHMK
jgi:hypothetical protein